MTPSNTGNQDTDGYGTRRLDDAPTRRILNAALPPLCLLFACFFAATVTIPAAYLETGEPHTHMPRRPPPTPIPPPPHVPAAVRRLLREVRIESPVVLGRLRVFPLVTTAPARMPTIHTLAEAMHAGSIDIREKSAAAVPEILVRNRSRHPVLMLSGALIHGGKQNRMLRDDALLPPHSTFLALPVYCIERRRWHGGGTFDGVTGLAHPALRKQAAERRSQSAVWNEIETDMRCAHVQSETEDYQTLREQRALREYADRIVKQLQPRWTGHTVGVLFTLDGRVLGADLFSDHSLFARLWPDICAAHAAEIRLMEPRHGAPVRPARGLLDRTLRAVFTKTHTPGLGTPYRIHGPVSGTVLISNGTVVHMALYPADNDVQPIYRH